MYVRRVIFFPKLAGTEIDFFVFLLSTRSSSIKSLSVENEYSGVPVPIPIDQTIEEAT